MSRRLALITAALLAIVGCNGGDTTTQPSASASGSSAATAPTASASGYQPGAQYDEADLKVPPDYEADAEKQISESNYKEQLEAIDNELSGTSAASTSASAAASAAAQAPPAKTPAPKAPAPAAPSAQ